MIVPEGFARELGFIDPTWRIEETENHDGYYIIKDVDLTMKIDGGKTLSQPMEARAHGPLVVLFFEDFGDRVLDALRKMKFQALELGIYENPVNERAWYQKLRRDAKKKRAELATEMISEGLMEAHRLERKKSFSYGGS